MSLGPGTRLGPYEIVAPIGAGGMGEVYKAKDTRLDRIVAIKVLPEALTGDPQFRERFDREARAISQLDHPHICALHDVGEHNGTSFLVMQYLDGETLEARLRKGALPLDQAFQIAIQIADALDKAHRAGIVHRDLKPSNVIVTKSGARLLDFGLAKTTPPAVAGAGLSMLPTTPPGGTKQGAILGTFQYMAPEQLEGHDADARTDIFAFGALLYEMLTGKRAFDGKNQAGVIGAILHVDPLSAISPRPPLPSSVQRLLKKCLAKDADDRWQTARDLADELKWIAESGPTAAPGVVRAARSSSDWTRRGSWLLLAATLLAISVFFIDRSPRSPVAGELTRFSVSPPEGTEFSSGFITTIAVPQFALAPNARTIVFAAAATGSPPMLWVRTMEEVGARSLAGTENAESPFWSPDGRWIAFFADGKLKKMASSGGPVQNVADVVDSRGGTWNENDTILFGTGTGSLYRGSGSGGTVTAFTKRDHQGTSHRYPQFLPDSRHFVFTIRSSRTERRGIWVGSLDDEQIQRVLAGTDASALYVPTGHLLYLDGDTLLGQAFDVTRRTSSGQAFTVAERVGRSGTGYGAFSAGATTLAYASAVLPSGRLTWFDRSGKELDTVRPEGDYVDFRTSPDDTRLATSLVDPKTGSADIWLTDLGQGRTFRLTHAPQINASAIWSFDGTRIFFRSNRNGGNNEFYQVAAAGGGSEST